MPQTPTASRTVFDDLASALGVSELVPLAQGGQKFVLRALRDGRPVAVKAMLVQPGPGFAAALDRARRETRVLAGTPEHRDSVLTAEERDAGRTMMICVGRCSTDRLVLDL